MLQETYPYYLANKPQAPNHNLEVTDKFTGEVATRVAMADAAAIDAGIAAAVEAQEALNQMAPFERQAILNHCVARFEERAEELAIALCIEAGKPIKDARGEVGRLIDTRSGRPSMTAVASTVSFTPLSPTQQPEYRERAKPRIP